ncbi:MAG: polyprenyl synthetase family protein [Bacteroidales bacterium]|nr:polyprenyl synthetase family protein [Bacteroidales bacterium]
MNTFKELLTKVKDLFEKENFVFEPRGLYDPIDYTLSLGGKRIRPVLLMAANEMFGGKAEEVAHAALGIETFHNFTLLHDDLMDRSPIRRGMPTVFRKWNDNTAILSGDTMFALAWRYFLRQPHANLQSILNTFNETAIEVCEGQQFDMDFETRSDVTISEYIEMIRLKTAVLLAGALKIGALYANAPAADIEHLYQFGIHAGLAFQLQDDWLDSFGDTATFGKQTGTDIKDNKKTYLFLKALEQSNPEQHNQLTLLFSNNPEDADSKVKEVLSIYEKLNIRTLTEQAIEEEFHLAEESLKAIQLPEERKSTLYEISRSLLGRDK